MEVSCAPLWTSSMPPESVWSAVDNMSDWAGTQVSARWVMGSILLAKGLRVEEAVEDLRFACREIPKARVQLAQFYERNGQRAEAVRELREFLPQASDQDRATVERWLSKLSAK